MSSLFYKNLCKLVVFIFILSFIIFLIYDRLFSISFVSCLDSSFFLASYSGYSVFLKKIFFLSFQFSFKFIQYFYPFKIVWNSSKSFLPSYPLYIKNFFVIVYI
jgi:hypothetical protein